MMTHTTRTTITPRMIQVEVDMRPPCAASAGLAMGHGCANGLWHCQISALDHVLHERSCRCCANRERHSDLFVLSSALRLDMAASPDTAIWRPSRSNPPLTW